MPDQPMPRRPARYQIQLPVLYRLASPAIKFGAGWTRNLSEGGAQVELDEVLRPETPMHLTLRTDAGSIEIGARVACSEGPQPPAGEVLHNLAFVDIDPGQLQTLRDLLLPLSMAPHAGIRLPLDIPVTCRQRGQAGSAVKGRTADMNRGGLLLRLPQSLPPRTPLAVTLHTTKGAVMVEGDIVWAVPPEQEAEGRLLEHGLRFTSPSWSVSLALGLLLAEAR